MKPCLRLGQCCRLLLCCVTDQFPACWLQGIPTPTYTATARPFTSPTKSMVTLLLHHEQHRYRHVVKSAWNSHWQMSSSTPKTPVNINTHCFLHGGSLINGVYHTRDSFIYKAPSHTPNILAPCLFGERNELFDMTENLRSNYVLGVSSTVLIFLDTALDKDTRWNWSDSGGLGQRY